jgi:hypothetical protein
VRLNDKWGFIDKTGKNITNIEYDDVKPPSQDLFPVRVGIYWGFVDSTGTQVIEPRFAAAGDYLVQPY